MSQEQKNSVQQEVQKDEGALVQTQNEEALTTPAPESGAKAGEVYVDIPSGSGKKRKKRRFRERLVYESEISPKPSFWPIALAFSVAMLLFGLIYNVYFLVIGAILVVVCISGWVFERRNA